MRFRVLASVVLAVSVATIAALPVAAKDTYPFYGPLEIGITGAGGEVRQFMALSSDDRLAASALVRELAGAIQENPPAVDTTPPDLPHYRISVSHMGLNYPTMPWSSDAVTSFAYYPGGDGPGFLFAQFSSTGSTLQARSIRPSPQVAAMIQHHLQGLAPITDEAATADNLPWGLVVGAIVLAVIASVLVEDRRRWRQIKKGAPAKGT